MRSLNILIVDDDEDYAESLSELLRLHRHHTVIARGGAEAVAKVAERSFDIVFMDIRMPGMNGIEALKALRSIRPGASVVMMTAYSVDEMLSDAVNLGARGVLHKPLKLSKLLDLLAEIGAASVILLVEDDAEFAAGVTEVLKARGFEVETLGTAGAAIDRIVNDGIGLVILDFRIPGGDGAGVIEELERLGIRTPVIMVTAYGDEASAKFTGVKAGRLEGILRKPFAMDELLALVERVESRAPDAGAR